MFPEVVAATFSGLLDKVDITLLVQEPFPPQRQLTPVEGIQRDRLKDARISPSGCFSVVTGVFSMTRLTVKKVKG